jgi:hypothetical protein
MHPERLRVIKKKSVSEENECSILITCKKPSKDGKMAVELTYEGDPVLVSYLLENVQGALDLEDDLLASS